MTTFRITAEMFVLGNYIYMMVKYRNRGSDEYRPISVKSNHSLPFSTVT